MSVSGISELRPGAPSKSKAPGKLFEPPDYVRAVATYGAGAYPDLPAASGAAYLSITWAVRSGALKDLHVAHHLYDLVRSGHICEALDDLQGRLAEHRTGDPMEGVRCSLPAGVGDVYLKCLWAGPPGTRDATQSWLLKNLQESDAASITKKLVGVVGDPGAALRIPLCDKPYAVTVLLTNMVRLEGLVKNTKAGPMSVGALFLVELSKDLEALASGSPDHLWVEVKALRLAMLAAALSVAPGTGGTDEARSKNRREQLRLLSLQAPKLEECAKLGKLVSQELVWNRAKSGNLYSRAATTLNVLFVNAYGPEKLRLASELKPVGKALDILIDSYAPGGLASYEALGRYFKVRCPALLGRGDSGTPRSTSSLVRALVRGKSTAAYITKNIDLAALPDPCLVALASRIPEILDAVPEDRVVKLANAYPQRYDLIFRQRWIQLGGATYGAYASRKPGMPHLEMLGDVARVQRRPQPVSRRFRVDAVLRLRLGLGWRSDDLLLWASQGAPGLPAGVIVRYKWVNVEGVQDELRIGYEGSDWSEACVVGDIVSWLGNRQYLGVVEGCYSFSMDCSDVSREQWERTVSFMDSNADALGAYFRVHRGRFQHPVKTYTALLLLRGDQRDALAEGVLYDLAGHATSSRLSSGRDVKWDDLASLWVAMAFLEALLNRGGGDLGEYVLPSTFLRRAGLEGALFDAVLHGKGAPYGATGQEPDVSLSDQWAQLTSTPAGSDDDGSL